jgi:hypothetical protein
MDVDVVVLMMFRRMLRLKTPAKNNVQPSVNFKVLVFSKTELRDRSIAVSNSS